MESTKAIYETNMRWINHGENLNEISPIKSLKALRKASTAFKTAKVKAWKSTDMIKRFAKKIKEYSSKLKKVKGKKAKKELLDKIKINKNKIKEEGAKLSKNKALMSKNKDAAKKYSRIKAGGIVAGGVAAGGTAAAFVRPELRKKR